MDLKIRLNSTLLKILLALPAVAGVIVFIVLLFRYESPAHKQIRRSAEDVLILYTATRERYSFNPVYPDWAFASEQARARYDLLPGMPQSLVDQYLKMGDDHPENVSFLNIGSYPARLTSDQAHEFESRLMNWRVLDRYLNARIIRIEMSVREHLTMPEVYKKLDKEMADRRIASAMLEEDLLQRTVIPHDPFAPSATDAKYRYGLSPRKPFTGSSLNPRTQEMTVHAFRTYPAADFIIAGNGPDGIADVDVTHFDSEISTVTQTTDPFLGLGKNPIDLIYDPTNGVNSSGDIFLIFPVATPAPTPTPLPAGITSTNIRSRSPNNNPAINGPRLGPKALWDESEFKKRYGLN